MKVWVDQDLCTGDGLCEELCPSVFVLHDSLSYVRTPDGSPLFAGGSMSMADVPEAVLDKVLDAAEDCPGECIFLEP
ncbi:MAG: ferredoxin [Actinomycetota bacterium]|nr:ferredoxin [Actinomycetota bacterium]